MFNWLKKVWNKNYTASEDGYKFASRSRRERNAVKADTKAEVIEAYDMQGNRKDAHAEAQRSEAG